MGEAEIVDPGTSETQDLSKIRVRIPKVGTVRFPAGMDPQSIDREARKLYMRAGAGQLPVRTDATAVATQTVKQRQRQKD